MNEIRIRLNYYCQYFLSIHIQFVFFWEIRTDCSFDPLTLRQLNLLDLVYFPSFPNLYVYIFTHFFTSISIFVHALSKGCIFFPSNFLYRLFECNFICGTFLRLWACFAKFSKHGKSILQIVYKFRKMCGDWNWLRTKLFFPIPSRTKKTPQTLKLLSKEKIATNSVGVRFYKINTPLSTANQPSETSSTLIPMFSPWCSLDSPYWQHQRDAVELCDRL